MKIIYVKFNRPIISSETELFRKFVCKYSSDSLLHNHREHEEEMQPPALNYSKIHYRSHDKHASMVGIDEGAELLLSLIQNEKFVSDMDGLLNAPMVHEHELLLTDIQQSYRLYKYIPLSPEHYKIYKNLNSFIEKISFIEEKLTAHLKFFLHQISGWDTQKIDLVKVTIKDIDRITKESAFGNPLMGFDMVFETNVSLPDKMALGRKIALGFGWLYRLTS
jgi:hypothetical protein